MAHLGLRQDFWLGRRVLLTGHTGFKGGWLSLWLQSLGAHVHGFALPPTPGPSLFEAANVADGMTHQPGDLRAPEQIEAAVRLARPEIVLHLASQALVRESYRDPVATFSTNVMGSIHLLEAIRRTPDVRALLVVTSDKCYLNREWPWPYRENEAMGGHDPYSASKACQELITAAWHESFLRGSVAVGTARAGNVIGGGDWSANRLIPDAIRTWDAGNTLSVRYPKAVRPWQYHLDALAGYLILAAELLEGRHAEAWNFGPTDTTIPTVEDLLAAFATCWEGKAKWQAAPGPHPHEASQLRLDSSKARQQLGWTSRYDLKQSLAAIFTWHQAWKNGEDMRGVCLRQINEYMNHAP